MLLPLKSIFSLSRKQLKVSDIYLMFKRKENCQED